jgi:cobalt-precorrin-6B (C15)-methyltransferase
MAKIAQKVISLDKRAEAVSMATGNARAAGVQNIDFFCTNAADFLKTSQVWDCAFLGGTSGLEELLPVVAAHVKRTIVINAVLLSTLERAVRVLTGLGLFCEVVQVQVSRSQEIAGSIMFRPIDPVYIIVALGAACSSVSVSGRAIAKFSPCGRSGLSGRPMRSLYRAGSPMTLSLPTGNRLCWTSR